MDNWDDNYICHLADCRNDEREEWMMKLSDYIKTSLGTFSPNPDEWTLLQRLGVEWGKQAFELEAENEALREWLGEDGLIEMAVVHEVDALLTKDD